MAFTYFFRDLQTLNMIRDLVLPTLRTRRYIDIWDAGCAHGPEPYTMAIILRENMGQFQFRNVRIHATDIDESNLFADIIHQGIYPNEQVKRIPKEVFGKYFTPNGKPDHFQLVKEIRNSVSFEKHDLLSFKPIRQGFGLVLCKNVLLHFKESERINVIKMFHQVLDKDGFLATEQTQKLPDNVSHLFEPVVSNTQLFRKVNYSG